LLSPSTAVSSSCTILFSLRGAGMVGTAAALAALTVTGSARFSFGFCAGAEVETGVCSGFTSETGSGCGRACSAAGCVAVDGVSSGFDDAQPHNPQTLTSTR